MFRAALLSIVLTLSAGQDAILLCSIWCHSGKGITGTCEHQTETSAHGVVANEGCDISNPVVFVRDVARVRTSGPDVGGALLAPRFAFVPPAADNLSACEPGSRLRLELRPLVLALRI